ncbi:MAG: hypothetical protein H0W78_13705 [Planctomycetes bacterium]|jgi:hypothetical protein|nr:hypothetical protein [Planctomycetota bacterium]
MSLLKFVPGRNSHLTATVATGRYVIVDYGREGFDATFTTTAGEETVVAPEKGGRFHKASRHAMACCEQHCARQASGNALP